MNADDRTAKADTDNTNAGAAFAQAGRGGAAAGGGGSGAPDGPASTVPDRQRSAAGHGGWQADPVLAQALDWLDEGRRVALATVTRTWGSAPRRAGSHMAIADDGDFVGSASGGCIEGAVIQAALEVIESGKGRSLEFGVTNEMAWEVGLACGGRVHLYVERVGG